MGSMHLLPVYYTTTSTKRRRKSKKTKSLLAAEREHEKFLKKMGIRGDSSVGRASGLQPEGHGFDPLSLHQTVRVVKSVNTRDLKSLDNSLASSSLATNTKNSRSSAGLEHRFSKPNVTGSSPVESTNNTAVVAQSVEHLICNQRVEGSNPSGGTTKWAPCTKKPEKVYTGTEIIGIGQMHKSNAVPIST